MKHILGTSLCFLLLVAHFCDHVLVIKSMQKAKSWLTNFNIHIKMINYDYPQTLTQIFRHLKFGKSWYLIVVSVNRATIKVF